MARSDLQEHLTLGILLRILVEDVNIPLQGVYKMLVRNGDVIDQTILQVKGMLNRRGFLPITSSAWMAS